MTRADILDAAARIFSEKGYHGTSMNDVADAVNLQKASIYHHFNSKQEILISLVDQALDMIIIRLEEVIQQSITPDEKLRKSIIAYMQTIAENQNLAAVLLLEFRAVDPELRDRHASKRERFERIWRDLIIEGDRAGVFNCVDPSITGRAILGVMNWSVTWYRNDGPKSAKEIANLYADLLLRGLMVQR